jgi:hypothetical protein
LAEMMVDPMEDWWAASMVDKMVDCSVGYLAEKWVVWKVDLMVVL